MKLSDIVITEADELNSAAEGSKLVELSDIVKFFPNTYQKAANTLMNKGRLTFGGEVLYKDGDHAPTLEHAIALAEEALKREEISMSFEIDGTIGDIDDSGTMEYEASITDTSFEYIGYDVQSNKLLVGFDLWVSEDDFNNAWDKSFEHIFGTPFDVDTPGHEEIFQHTWDEYTGKRGRKRATMFGAIVEINEDMHAEPDQIFDGGLHKHWTIDEPKESAIAHLASSPEARKRIANRSGLKPKPAERRGRRIIDLS